MKYIRTKNSVYELVRDADDWVVAIGSVQKQLGCKCTIRKSNILKQADTIEELIDEYVAKKDYSRPFVIKKYEIYSNLQFGFTIYGSIWVDGDLHKVAKMNEKGELELL